MSVSISIQFGMNNKLQHCAPQPRKAFHLTQRVDYALFLLSILAKQKKNTSTSLGVVARTYSMSFAFLQNVARLLTQHDLIKGTRGKQGGYVLNRSSQTLSVKEIIEYNYVQDRILYDVNLDGFSE